MNALESFVLKGEQGIYVNLYTPFACKFDDAQVEIGGSYLEDGKVSILVETEKADTLFRSAFSSVSTETAKKHLEKDGIRVAILNWLC